MRIPTNAPASVKINNKNLRDFGIELTGYPSSLLLPPITFSSSKLLHTSKSYLTAVDVPNWNFELRAYIVGDNHEQMIERVDDFKRWIDLENQNLPKWNIGQKTMEALKFELAGHRYWYTSGTVQVTQGSANVTGTSTNWLSYAKPGVEFKVSGDTNTYIVRNITSDTAITLTSTVSRANGSTLSYQLERRRYLLVNYEGASSLSHPTGRAHFKDEQYDFTINFMTAYPVWVGDEFEIKFSSLSANSFSKLRGIGNFPQLPEIHITGAANKPKIAAANFEFSCDYHFTTNFRDIYNDYDRVATTSP